MLFRRILIWGAQYLVPRLDGRVLIGSSDGHMYALAPETGALKWKLCPMEGCEVDSTLCTDGRTGLHGQDRRKTQARYREGAKSKRRKPKDGPLAPVDSVVI